ncbi:MAG TPA: amidohydrolase family protein [Firmicutes bacterium]|nr:amidohydrolase family protein [Bacillota bacterium]
MEVLDLSQQQVIDAHCHPCPPRHPQTWEEFCGLFTLRVPRPGREMAAVTPILNEQTLLQLARLFACEPTPEKVMAEHSRRAQDPAAYTRLLMKDANIAGLVVDFGYPQPPLSPDYWREVAGVKVAEVFRIEPLVQRLLGECSDFSSFRLRYREEVAAALSRPVCAGLKSIIAYRSGLGISLASPEEAAKDFEGGKRGEGGSLKRLRDWCLLEAMLLCRQFDKVMTIHTGAGDSEIRLETARPELLYDLLTTDPFSEVRTVLVHAGYPWCRQAAFMVNVMDNVYLDTSLVSPFSGPGVKAILEEILHIAPVEKVMHGSDNFSLPEVGWMGAILTRAALAAIFGRLVEEGAVRREYARHAADRILRGNAVEFFRLAAW